MKISPADSKLTAEQIARQLSELGLSKDDFVVVGAGVLAALGLLAWDDDIDLAITPEVFEQFLSDSSWRQEEWQGKTVLKRGVFDVGVGFAQWSLEELQADALRIDSVPYMSLQKLREWKLQIGRPKDLEHVKLIDDYLARQAV